MIRVATVYGDVSEVSEAEVVAVRLGRAAALLLGDGRTLHVKDRAARSAAAALAARGFVRAASPISGEAWVRPAAVQAVEAIGSWCRRLHMDGRHVVDNADDAPARAALSGATVVVARALLGGVWSVRASALAGDAAGPGGRTLTLACGTRIPALAEAPGLALAD